MNTKVGPWELDFKVRPWYAVFSQFCTISNFAMRHHNANRKLGRKRGQRKALLKTLAVSLITRGKISTTEAKAKELRPFAEKLISEAKKGTLSARRNVSAVVGSRTGKKLVDDIAPKYAERHGGYIRVVRLGVRKSDGSRISLIELV